MTSEEALAGMLALRLAPKRKVFISYHHTDQAAVDTFLRVFAFQGGVFTPKVVGASGYESAIVNSDDPQYVMSRIRQDYIGDASVTMVLVGSCTHSRRYVDWEIKATLSQPKDQQPTGLLGINLTTGLVHLPQRLADNSLPDPTKYARFYAYPTSALELKGWIEAAYKARTQRAALISNPQEMMKYNGKCKVCAETH